MLKKIMFLFLFAAASAVPLVLAQENKPDQGLPMEDNQEIQDEAAAGDLAQPTAFAIMEGTQEDSQVYGEVEITIKLV